MIARNMGTGGAVFVRMTLMGVNGTEQSTGSLQGGTGTLVSKLRCTWKGEASPDMKRLLSTPGGQMKLVRTIPKDLDVVFGPLSLRGHVEVSVQAGEDEGSAALLIVALRLEDPKDGGITWSKLGNLRGQTDALRALVPTGKASSDGQQPLGLEDGQPEQPRMISVHAPGMEPITTTEDCLDATVQQVLDVINGAAASKGAPKASDTTQAADAQADQGPSEWQADMDLPDGTLLSVKVRPVADEYVIEVPLPQGGTLKAAGPSQDEAMDNARRLYGQAATKAEDVPAEPVPKQTTGKVVRMRGGRKAKAVKREPEPAEAQPEPAEAQEAQE